MASKRFGGAAGFALGAGARALATSLLGFGALLAGERRLYAAARTRFERA